MSGSLSCGATKNRPDPGKSAELFSPTDHLAQGSRSAGSAGVGRRSNSPPGPSGLILDGFSSGIYSAPGRYGHFNGHILLG